jgi:hypothetical protein
MLENDRGKDDVRELPDEMRPEHERARMMSQNYLMRCGRSMREAMMMSQMYLMR